MPGQPGHRRDHVSATKRRAPQADSIVIYAFKSAGVGHRRGPVGKLHADVEQLPRLAFAVTEVALVEHQPGVAGRTESFGAGVNSHGAHRPQAVRHHQQRREAGADTV
jgi:hypothetical protein